MNICHQPGRPPLGEICIGWVKLGSPEISRQSKVFWMNSQSLNRLRAFFLAQQRNRTAGPQRAPILRGGMEGLGLPWSGDPGELISMCVVSCGVSPMLSA